MRINTPKYLSRPRDEMIDQTNAYCFSFTCLEILLALTTNNNISIAHCNCICFVCLFGSHRSSKSANLCPSALFIFLSQSGSKYLKLSLNSISSYYYQVRVLWHQKPKRQTFIFKINSCKRPFYVKTEEWKYSQNVLYHFVGAYNIWSCWWITACIGPGWVSGGVMLVAALPGSHYVTR